ncbi:hypothetical protein M9Y10_012195 [Tritrichomonas musculus]|uniref:Uncharacterized protein n=1 Tax=Tritrichomonas musculus TaxID=1915356 RepID=A0ABR2IBW3_9EUKA
MSDHIFFPFDNSSHVQKYKEDLLNHPEFKTNDFTPAFPFNIMHNPYFNIDEIISSILRSKTSENSIDLGSLIMQAPDELIDFSTLDFSQLASLNRLGPQLKSELELGQEFGLGDLVQIDYLTKIKNILPIFIRCSIEEISKKEYIKPVSLIMREFPDHPITTIFRILFYARMILISKNPQEIKFNLENALIQVNPLIQKLCDDQEIEFNKELITFIFPFLLPKITEIICSAVMYSFDLTIGVEPTKFNLLNLLGQYFVLIASNYPPSFEKTGWQTFSKYFSKFGSTQLIEDKNYPDYSFIIKFPHLVEPAVIACCVTDLINSFNLLSYLGLSLSNYKKMELYGVLISLIHENQSFGRSVSKSLINISRYQFYSSSFEEFKRDLSIVEPKNLAAALYGLMAAFNFDEDFAQFEMTHKLSLLISDLISDCHRDKLHLNGFQRLAEMNAEEIKTVFDYAHLSNALVARYCRKNDQKEIEKKHIDLSELAIWLNENNFLNSLEKFLNDCIQKKSFLDFKFAQPFIVAASRYIEIKAVTLSLTNKEYLGINVDFVLNLYHSILLAGPALMTKKQNFTTLSCDLYKARSIIARSIESQCPNFLFVASEFVKTRRMSLLEPFIIFISDYLLFSASFNSELFVSIVNDSLPYFLKAAMLTESTIVSKAVVNILTKLCQKLSLQVIDPLIVSIIEFFSSHVNKYEQSKDSAREATKVLFYLRELSSDPYGKICIVSNSKINLLCNLLNTCLARQMSQEVKYLTLTALELITNLLCPSITLNLNLDFILRCGSEIPPSYSTENIITAICALLNPEKADSLNDKVLIGAIRALRYGCENPFIVRILNGVPQFKLNINDFEKKTKVFQKSEFYLTLLELTYVIAKVDSDYAFELIGLAEDATILSKPELKKEKIAGDIYNLSKKDAIKKYPEFLLSVIQKSYNSDKVKYSSEKIKSAKSPMPPNTSTSYMDELPKDFYENYFDVQYKKKK